MFEKSVLFNILINLVKSHVKFYTQLIFVNCYQDLAVEDIFFFFGNDVSIEPCNAIGYSIFSHASLLSDAFYLVRKLLVPIFYLLYQKNKLLVKIIGHFNFLCLIQNIQHVVPYLVFLPKRNFSNPDFFFYILFETTEILCYDLFPIQVITFSRIYYHKSKIANNNARSGHCNKVLSKTSNKNKSGAINKVRSRANNRAGMGAYNRAKIEAGKQKKIINTNSHV